MLNRAAALAWQARRSAVAKRPLSSAGEARYPSALTRIQPLLSVLNSDQISSLRSSFAALEPLAPVVAGRFYSRLFELDPSLRGLFHGDMRSQGQKLMGMLGFIVGNLEEPETLVPAVEELGIRHAGYRVEPRHYETVGVALIAAMADTLGEAFTREAAGAWREAYDFLAKVMIDAAESARGA